LSNADVAYSGGSRQLNTLRLIQVIALAFVAVKVAFILTVGPASDEVYYWMWGRIPELSYFDHPPLHSWLLGLTYNVFGRSLFALRFLTLLSMAGTFWIFMIWAQRLSGRYWQSHFWFAAAIYLASPTFGLFGSVAFHDHLLIFLCLLSGHCFITYLTVWETRGKLARGSLYLGAVVLGLAALTKYSAIFLGLGVVGVIVFGRPYRRLLTDPHLYLAAIVSVAMLTPVFVWNVQHGFASFAFHLSDRHGGGYWMSDPDFSKIWEFPLASLILVSPFVFIAMFRFFLARLEPGFERTARWLAAWVFWISTLTFVAVSLFDYVNWWWNLVAYILVMPFAARYMGRRWMLWLHIAFGAVLTALLFVSMAIVPLINVFGGYDWRFSTLYGWEQLEVSARKAVAQYDPDFIASDGPEVASLTGFAIDTTNVTSLDPSRRSQYDYWFDRPAHAGQNAVVVIDSMVDPSAVSGYFTTLTPIDSIDISRFGVFIRGFRLFYGEGYVPP
jgi:hypothetical protein